MSRILRRPMFRGGRVDSRGTGITSGLSYAKGGRVGYDNGGGVFPVGGKMYSFAQSPVGSSLMYGIPGALGDMIYSPINQIGRMFGFNPGLSSRKGIRDQKDYLFGTDRPDRMSDEEVQTTNFLGFPLSAQSYGEKKIEEEQAKIDKIEKEKADQLKLDLEKKRIAELANKSDDTEEKPTIDKDALTERKELFAELLGGGKARGEDISNMLMSFAGKALKPEADVKTAFGEFFEEEAKRPSRRDKVDDAAATLAINEYIAGKKSKAELDRFFAQADYKSSLTSRRGKKNIALNIADASKSNSGYKAIDLGLRISFPEAGRPNKMDASEGQTVDKVPLTVDNVGQIFIEDEAPYSAVMITIQDGQLIRDPLN